MAYRQLRDPRKGYVHRFSDFEVDVETFVKQVMLPDCPPPYYALAHSMGAHILLRFLREHPRRIASAVLTAPMVTGTSATVAIWCHGAEI